jgi:hypothetical protein
MGMIMPIGGRGQMMYIPDTNHGPSGPWTLTDTKVTIALLIIFFLVSLISIIIEWQFAKKKITGKEFLIEVLTCGMSGSYFCKYEVSMFTGLMTLCFYIIFALFAIGSGVYGIFQLL